MGSKDHGLWMAKLTQTTKTGRRISTLQTVKIDVEKGVLSLVKTSTSRPASTTTTPRVIEDPTTVPESAKPNSKGKYNCQVLNSRFLL